jgi:hypothetical protein
VTLILTEVSPFGIAMVADSAMTTEAVVPSGKKRLRVTYGLRKLQEAPSVNGCVSYWGAGEIQDLNRVPTDLWLEDFTEQNSGIHQLKTWVEKLTDKLNALRPPSALGFHAAGYIGREKKMPVVYRVANHDRLGSPLREFRCELLWAPTVVKKVPDSQLYADGDLTAYAPLSQAVDSVLPDVRKNANLVIPGESLEERARYLAAWVSFVSDVYESSGKYRTIGGDVLVAVITGEGSRISNVQ